MEYSSSSSRSSSSCGSLASRGSGTGDVAASALVGLGAEEVGVTYNVWLPFGLMAQILNVDVHVNGLTLAIPIT